MNNSQKLLSLTRLCHRQLARSASQSEQVPDRIRKLREAQKHFGIEDDIPVYIKGGFSDKLFFGVTTAVIGVGFAMSLETAYDVIMRDS